MLPLGLIVPNGLLVEGAHLQDLSVNLNDIREAREVIKGVVRKTPLSFVQSEALRTRDIYLLSLIHI